MTSSLDHSRKANAAAAIVVALLWVTVALAVEALRADDDKPAAATPDSQPPDGANRPTSHTKKIDFGVEIQPIFAKRCFTCHGPDKFEGGLRLHKRQSALAELDSGERAIVPGNTESSMILERIANEDPDLRMPP